MFSILIFLCLRAGDSCGWRHYDFAISQKHPEGISSDLTTWIPGKTDKVLEGEGQCTSCSMDAISQEC